MEDRPAKKMRLEPETQEVVDNASVPTEAPAAVQEKAASTPPSLWQRIERMDFEAAPQEHEVGITEYVEPHSPAIHGILKHRYIDFVVHEVDLQGNVVTLTNLDKPQGEPSAPVESSAACEASTMTFESDESQFLIKTLGQERWDALLEYFKAGRPPKKAAANTLRTPVSTDPIADKADRTSFHKAVRAVFGGQLATETQETSQTEDGRQQQSIKIVWGSGKDRSRSVAAQRVDYPPYLHFTLHKCNKETQDCLTRIGRLLKVNARDLGIAGTKDKRGVTTQRVSLHIKKFKPPRNAANHPLVDAYTVLTGPQARPSKNMKFKQPNKQGELQGIRVGNFDFAQSALDLGQLRGNLFNITLRDVNPDVLSSLDHVVSVVREKGFINYYGMQRFGTSSVPTHAIGLALLRSDWETAVKLIMCRKPGEQAETVAARDLWNSGQDAKAALRIMPRHAVAERFLLEAFAKSQSNGEAFDYLAALSKIPKNLKMMYVHGYQSYLWNTVLSERIRRYGCDKPLVGDVVYADPAAAFEGDEEGNEQEAAADAEDVAMTTQEPANGDAADAEGSKDTAAEPAALSKIEKLRLNSKVPAVKKLTQEDIDSGRYTIHDVLLPLPGFVVGYPEGPLGSLYRGMVGADGLDPDNLHRSQPEYSMAGTYRKIMHRPSRMEHKVLRYNDSDQALALSDEDIVLGRSLPPLDPEGKFTALQFEIQLGTSSYATMALRELLKAATNSEAQKVLTQEMSAKNA